MTQNQLEELNLSKIKHLCVKGTVIFNSKMLSMLDTFGVSTKLTYEEITLTDDQKPQTRSELSDILPSLV